MKHGILTTLILGMALIASAQDVVQLRPEKFNDYALNYYLPKTITEIEFVASKTTRKAGGLVFCRFVFLISLSHREVFRGQGTLPLPFPRPTQVSFRSCQLRRA